MYAGIGVGATFIAVVFGISGQAWAMALCLLGGAASILWGIWPQLRKKWRPAEARHDSEPLVLNTKVMQLPMPDELRGRDKIAAALAVPHFGLLQVKNDGPKNISSLIPEVYIDGSETTALGVWTTDRGKSFEPVGLDGISLNVGAKRLFVIAVAFPSKKQQGGGGIWYPVDPGKETKYYFDQVRLMARNRTLGTSADVKVRFRAEGIHQVIRLRLGFESNGSPTAYTPSHSSP
jgi:hypothetical protein